MSYERIALFSQVVSAILFIAAMVFIWVKYLQPAVLAAQESHNRQIAEAERHRNDAKAALDALQGEIGSAQADAEAIKQRALAQAEREHDAAVAEAKTAGERAVRNAGGELDRRRAAARMQLRTELLDKALDVAREQAAQRVDGPINARLVHAFADQLTARQAAEVPHG
ncbi:MAG: ATP synthase F0 subunit B [Candidatus Eremiobacteraeota bacterium]|nr:ATP synthase F0 subunit B [Candidatus Eremiobacteraeota bacterium]